MPRKKTKETTPDVVDAAVATVEPTAVLDQGSPYLDDDILREFVGRQKECLEEAEEQILGLESGTDTDVKPDLLRFLHTLKGEAGLLGFGDISDVCHATEDMLQERELTACVEILLRLHDWLELSMNHLGGDENAPGPAADILALLHADPAPAAQAATPKPDPLPATAQPTDLGPVTGDPEMLPEFLAEAQEHLEDAEVQLLSLETDPDNTDALDGIFRAFHTLKGLAGFLDLNHVQALAHRSETMLDLARKGAIRVEGTVANLTFGSIDMLKELVDDIGEAMTRGRSLILADGYEDLLQELIGVTENPEQFKAATPPPEPVPIPGQDPKQDGSSGFVPLNELKTDDGPATGFVPLAPPANTTPAPAPPPPAAPKADRPSAPTTARVKEAVRVDADRLDHLVTTIGELVIAESMVGQSPELASASPHLRRSIDQLDKITRDLQEIGMSLRMVPIRPVFQKMARLVRDLAAKTDRTINFTMTGEDTELDKAVVDKIGDPLVHMVRNAVDHGIEKSPEDRIAAGKPPAGRIELRSFHKGGRIHIEIRDDGRGLDKDRILAKARERGLVRESDVLSDRDIYNLIFKPGFSTAEQVTEISGRGVGMDVVRRFIESLRGTVEIQSEIGKGSTFNISLPLTLAIIEGMVVRLGAEHYIIPTLSIVRLIRPREGDVSTVLADGEMISVNGELVPLFRLQKLFDADDAVGEPHKGVLMVIEDDNKRAALLVDELLGQQQIVIKSLSGPVEDTMGVAGGAIMSTGNVALILDVSGIVRIAQAETGTERPTTTA